MKTIKLALTVIAVAIVAIATAVEKPKMSVIPLTANKAMVSIKNENEAMFELSIHAKNGDLVYYKESTKPLSSYQKIFNFRGLSNGSYIMNLKINNTKLSKEFEVASKKILVGESKLRFDPYFNFTDDVLKITYLNFDKENVRLHIYGKNGLIYRAKLGAEFNILSGYNLSQLLPGSYQVVLSTNGNEFTYNLEK